MKINGIIFDLDGTLLNTIEDLGNSMNMVLAKHGFKTHSTTDYYSFIGGGAKSLVKKSLPKFQRESCDFEEYLREYREVYRDNWNINTRVYDGIFDMLNKLKNMDISMAVLSNKPHSDLLKCVDLYFKNIDFKYVAGQQDSIPHKPEPDGAIIIANKLGIQPKEIVFVGDSGVDMMTAKASGMIALGVSWGFREKKELLESGADYIIDQPGDLLTFLDKISLN